MSEQSLISKEGRYSTTDDLYNLLPEALKDVSIGYSKNSNEVLVYAFDAINNMMLNVLFTIIGERDFEPTFGSNRLAILQEPNDYIVADQIEVELYDRIRYWVPYIDIAMSGIICQPMPRDQQYMIVFVYRERVTGIQNTFTTYISNTGLFSAIPKSQSIYGRAT